MCEILIKANANFVSDDPEINKGIYQRDDPVVVMPDGWNWGREELNPDKFYIIYCPGVDCSEAENYLKEYVTNEVLNMRRKYKIDRRALRGSKVYRGEIANLFTVKEAK